MKTFPSARLLAAPALLAGLLAACTSGAGVPVSTPAGQPPPSLPASVSASLPVPSASAKSTHETIALKVYFEMHDPRGIESLVPVHRSIPWTEDVAAGAMRALLAGPTAEERSGHPGRHGQLAPLSTALPGATRLLGIDIQNRIATVDLSGAFSSGDQVATVHRQAQVVYTLTQFPSVDGVKFRVDGAPMSAIEGHEGTAITGPATRRFYFDQRRSVFVDEPAWGAPVGDSFLVTGETTSDSEIRVAVVDGATGRIIAEQRVRASCHPCIAPDAWGPFEARLSMPAGTRPADLRLRITEPPSSEGGSPMVVDYLLGTPGPEPTADLVPFDCAAASLPATVDRAQIADVRVGSHGSGPSGYDRIVFEFQGPGIPEVMLGAGTPPFRRDPSDLPLPVEGSSFLVLALRGATAVTPEGTITYGGPISFAPGFAALTELKEAGDFEAVSSWVAGLTGPSCHRLLVLENPTRLVIDLQHPAPAGSVTP
jgi:spore germination protein GerM